MAVIFFNGIDHLAPGTDITPANSGDAASGATAFDGVDVDTGSFVASQSKASVGPVAMRFQTNAIQGSPQAWKALSNITRVIFDFHLLVDPIPPATLRVLTAHDLDNSPSFRVLSNAKVAAYDKGGRLTTSTGLMTVNVHSRFRWDLVADSGPAANDGSSTLEIFWDKNAATPDETIVDSPADMGEFFDIMNMGIMYNFIDQQVAFDEFTADDPNASPPPPSTDTGMRVLMGGEWKELQMRRREGGVWVDM